MKDPDSQVGRQTDRCINNKALKFHLRVMDTGAIGSDWDLHRARDRQIYSLQLHFMFSSPSMQSTDLVVTVLSFFSLPVSSPILSLSLSLSLSVSILSV